MSLKLLDVSFQFSFDKYKFRKFRLIYILIFYYFLVNACQKTKSSVKRQAGVSSDLNQIVEASQQMENMLDTILGYVDDVIAGNKTADNTFGRSLLDMIHSVPKMTPEEFEEMLNSNRKVCHSEKLF